MLLLRLDVFTPKLIYVQQLTKLSYSPTQAPCLKDIRGQKVERTGSLLWGMVNFLLNLKPPSLSTTLKHTWKNFLNCTSIAALPIITIISHYQANAEQMLFPILLTFLSLVLMYSIFLWPAVIYFFTWFFDWFGFFYSFLVVILLLFLSICCQFYA